MEIFYCDKCGLRIETEVPRGGMFQDEQGNYFCSKCKPEDAVLFGSPSNKTPSRSFAPISPVSSTTNQPSPARVATRQTAKRSSSPHTSWFLAAGILAAGVAILWLVMRNTHDTQPVHPKPAVKPQDQTAVLDTPAEPSRLQPDSVKPEDPLPVPHTTPTRPATPATTRTQFSLANLHGKLISNQDNLSMFWDFSNPIQLEDFECNGLLEQPTIQENKLILRTPQVKDWNQATIRIKIEIPRFIELQQQVYRFLPRDQYTKSGVLLFWNGKRGQKRKSLSILFMLGKIAIVHHRPGLPMGKKNENLEVLAEIDQPGMTNLDAFKSMRGSLTCRMDNKMLTVTMKDTIMFSQRIDIPIDPDQVYVGLSLVNSDVALSSLRVSVKK